MPPFGGSPKSHPLAGTAPAVILAAEDALRPLRSETVAWFDPSGILIGHKAGQPTTVGFDATELASMPDAILTHNHPLGWTYPPNDPRRAGNSFSDDDLAFAVAADLAEIRAVTPLLRFSAKRPALGWGATPTLIRLYHAGYVQIVDAEMDLAVVLGSMTLEEHQATVYHEAVKRLATQHGLRYERWEG